VKTPEFRPPAPEQIAAIAAVSIIEPLSYQGINGVNAAVAAGFRPRLPIAVAEGKKMRR
jgi:hypothetical protein